MTRRPSLFRTVVAWAVLLLALPAPLAAEAADIGMVTLIEGNAKVLRGTTWYKLVPGAVVADGDIVEVDDRAHAHVEFAQGGAANLVGPAALYFTPMSMRAGEPRSPRLLGLPRGWLKVESKAPGIRLRTPALDVATTDGILVVHARRPDVEVYVESGAARLIELRPNGSDGATSEAKHGEYWMKRAAAPLAAEAHVPREFVKSMPKHYADRLPAFAARFTSPSPLASDREVTFAEAEPWLAGRDRAVFERRFAPRLRDPGFRRDAGPHVHRYPSWDRMLNPEKYSPKP
jgi:hypothetical protein